MHFFYGCPGVNLISTVATHGHSTSTINMSEIDGKAPQAKSSRQPMKQRLHRLRLQDPRLFTAAMTFSTSMYSMKIETPTWC
jgi:hypothetical protein